MIANDLEYYNYVLNRNYIRNHKELITDKYFQKLNQLEGRLDFIFAHYGEGGDSDRLYFQKKMNKVDAICQEIEI